MTRVCLEPVRSETPPDFAVRVLDEYDGVEVDFFGWYPTLDEAISEALYAYPGAEVLEPTWEEPTPARALCELSHRKASQRGILVGRRTPAALVGALLDEMNAESAHALLQMALRTAKTVVDEEVTRSARVASP